MSKRFIDTGLFDDDWYMDISKDAKLLWLYFITKCNHAGILKINMKLCQVQTGIKDIDSVIKELGNRLVTVSEHLYFVPKFIEYQYPGFPRSNVRQQDSALDILVKYGLYNKENLTVIKELPNTCKTVTKELNNSYDSDSDIDIVIVEGGTGGEIIKNWRDDFEVYKEQLRSEYTKIISNRKYISERENYHPGLNIAKSIEKACKDFWSKEAGWKKKKQSKTVNIDWEATFNNAISIKSNQVWKQKEVEAY